jgi:hypothetical protein
MSIEKIFEKEPPLSMACWSLQHLSKKGDDQYLKKYLKKKKTMRDALGGRALIVQQGHLVRASPGHDRPLPSTDGQAGWDR